MKPFPPLFPLRPYPPDMDPIVAAMPPVRIVFGRDYLRGPAHFEFGFMWDRKPWPRLGELIYQKWWIVRLSVDRRP